MIAVTDILINVAALAILAPWREDRASWNLFAVLSLSAVIIGFACPMAKDAAYLSVMLLCGGGLGNVICGFKLFESGLVKKAHPDAVTAMRNGKRLVSSDEANGKCMEVLMFTGCQLVLAFFVSFFTENFAEALFISAEILSAASFLRRIFVHKRQ